MKSIFEIISDINQKDKVPDGKNLEVIIPVLSQTNKDVWYTRFPSEDKIILGDIKTNHVAIIGNSNYSIRLCDNFYFSYNFQDYSTIYKSMYVKAGTATFRVSYRFIDSVEYDSEDIKKFIERILG